MTASRMPPQRRGSSDRAVFGWRVAPGAPRRHRALAKSLHDGDQALTLPWQHQIREDEPLNGGGKGRPVLIVVPVQHHGGARRQSKAEKLGIGSAPSLDE